MYRRRRQGIIHNDLNVDITGRYVRVQLYYNNDDVFRIIWKNVRYFIPGKGSKKVAFFFCSFKKNFENITRGSHKLPIV